MKEGSTPKKRKENRRMGRKKLHEGRKKLPKEGALLPEKSTCSLVVNVDHNEQL